MSETLLETDVDVVVPPINQAMLKGWMIGLKINISINI